MLLPAAVFFLAFIYATAGIRHRGGRYDVLAGYALQLSALLWVGVAANFFFYIAVNLSMVMGMAPVVGVPLPLLSYGGSAMLVLLVGFGLVQSAHVHRPR